MPPASRSRIVLVTGGAQRLGRETALLLARAGWRVALHCRHSVFLNLGLKSKNASVVRRRHEVNRFNTLTL